MISKHVRFPRKVRELPRKALYSALALVAGGGLALGLVLPGFSSASIVGDDATLNAAGHFVSGAQFRFVSTTFSLPKTTAYLPNNVPGLSVKLRSGLETVVLGISTTSAAGPWNAGVAQEYPNGTVGFSDGSSPAMAPGDNVTESLYYDTTSHRVFYNARDNTTGDVFSGSFFDEASPGVRQSFTQARVTADFAADEYTTTPAAWTAPSSTQKFVAFKDSRVTTYSGHHGSLLDWWTTGSLCMTNNGSMPPAGHVEANAGAIWGSGSQAGENFSVFLQP